ncbi:MAG TPA: hypothetical protein VJ780_09160, partial [Flavobacterium sp.]|nr:hypothetical protein [Flavobacterium sp.]
MTLLYVILKLSKLLEFLKPLQQHHKTTKATRLKVTFCFYILCAHELEARCSDADYLEILGLGPAGEI